MTHAIHQQVHEISQKISKLKEKAKQASDAKELDDLEYEIHGWQIILDIIAAYEQVKRIGKDQWRR